MVFSWHCSTLILVPLVAMGCLLAVHHYGNDNGLCNSYMDPQGLQHVSRSRFDAMKRFNASEMTLDIFVDYVSHGEPFVVRHAFDDWPSMKEITNCSRLSQLYPELTYHDWQSGQRQALGTIADWTCRSGYLESTTFNEWAMNRASFQDWLSGIPTPSFMPPGTLYGPHDNQTHMSVFIGMPSTGVAPHVDENCDSFISIQFAGRKRWTVAWPEKSSVTGELAWSAPQSVHLERGDAIIWYMSQLHHTEVVEGCSVSTSLQFSHPAPNIYYKNLRALLDSTDDWRNLYQYAGAYNTSYIKSCSVVAKPDQHNQWMVQSSE